MENHWAFQSSHKHCGVAIKVSELKARIESRKSENIEPGSVVWALDIVEKTIVFGMKDDDTVPPIRLQLTKAIRDAYKLGHGHGWVECLDKRLEDLTE